MFGISTDHQIEVHRDSMPDHILFDLGHVIVSDYILSWNKTKATTEYVKVLEIYNFDLDSVKIKIDTGAGLMISMDQNLFSYKSPVHSSEFIVGKTMINTIDDMSTIIFHKPLGIIPVINFKLSGNNNNFICNGIIICSIK